MVFAYDVVLGAEITLSVLVMMLVTSTSWRAEVVSASVGSVVVVAGRPWCCGPAWGGITDVVVCAGVLI